MGSHGTFMFWRLGSVAFKLFAAIDLYSVNCGHVAAKRSAGHAAKLLAEMWLLPWNVIWLPTILVATALCNIMYNGFKTLIIMSEFGVPAILTSFCRLGLAPPARRSSTSLWWPWKLAKYKGVKPCCSGNKGVTSKPGNWKLLVLCILFQIWINMHEYFWWLLTVVATVEVTTHNCCSCVGKVQRLEWKLKHNGSRLALYWQDSRYPTCMLEKVFSNLLSFDGMEVNWKYTNYYSCLYWNPPSYVFKLSIHISLIWHSVSIIVLSLVQYVLYSVINLSTFCTYCTAKLY